VPLTEETLHGGFHGGLPREPRPSAPPVPLTEETLHGGPHEPTVPDGREPVHRSPGAVPPMRGLWAQFGLNFARMR